MRRSVLFGLVIVLFAASSAAAADMVALPGTVTLSGPRAVQSLVVVRRQGREYVGDLTGSATFRSTNPKVARVDRSGTIRPVSDGRARVRVTAGGESLEVPVQVVGLNRPSVPSFTREVLPVLTRAGCNSGACHGAAAGKGGLKLTLRGYDPMADWGTLTRQALGRRVTPGNPDASLMLLKPTMGIPHGGGERFKRGAHEYRVIREWIAAGSPPPSSTDPILTGISVLPPHARLRPGSAQRLIVRASYSDGTAADVTRWVKFGASNDSVAGVEDTGQIRVKSPGEAAVTAWYSSKVAFAPVSVPYSDRVEASRFAPSPGMAPDSIDALVLKKLRSLGIPPAAAASDQVFLRRAFLDAAGVLPTPDEVQRFLADPAPDKRSKLIDALTLRPEFTDYWAYKWSDLLLVSSRKLPTKGMWAFSGWIRDRVAENAPWDRIAREVITARGSTLQNGAANFLVLHKDPIDLTETTTQAFLGMSLTCARCHNHPLEKWTQNDYYQMANLFGRVRLKNGETPGETVVFEAAEGNVSHPRTNAPLPPRPLDGDAMSLAETADRRVHLARWLTSPKNPYFARALVNRVWRNFMGRGLVEAEDDLRQTNPPSNSELLETLSNQFSRQGYDLRWLVRTILASAAYQRASEPAAGAPADDRFYSTYIPRRLSAEVLLDALSQATAVPTSFAGYPTGTRAMQLVDTQVASYFLSAFGRPQRVQTCSCERQDEPNVAQALHLTNGDTVNDKIRAPQGILASITPLDTPGKAMPDEGVIEQLYLRTYCRPPTEVELKRVLSTLDRFTVGAAGAQARREAFEDLFSALLTSREFLFNH